MSASVISYICTWMYLCVSHHVNRSISSFMHAGVQTRIIHIFRQAIPGNIEITSIKLTWCIGDKYVDISNLRK